MTDPTIDPASVQPGSDVDPTSPEPIEATEPIAGTGSDSTLAVTQDTPSTESLAVAETVDVVVVGAGLSGLSLAKSLVDRSPQTRVLVIEAQNRVGGNITTVSRDGFLWEEGPNSFSPTPELLKLAVDVGLKDDVLFADGKLPRFVYWDGRLQPVPMGPGAMVRSTLLSDRGKLRMALGAAGFVRPKLGQDLADRAGEESVREFFSRHLGREVMERLVDPFVSGVYAGNPDRLSAAAAFGRVVAFEESGGGLVAGAVRNQLAARKARKGQPPAPIDPNLPKPKRGELGSFKGGLQRLPEAIAAQLGDRVKLGWSVDRVARSADGPGDASHTSYRLTVTTPEGPRQIAAKSVVLAVPAKTAGAIVGNLAPQAQANLTAIDYPPVACVILGYPEAAFRQSLNGFGALFPRSLGLPTLGMIWGSSLFPGRAPAGWAMLINFIGGSQNRSIANLDSDAIAQCVHKDVRRVLLKEDVAPKVLAVHLWQRAIPQYEVGHADRLAAIAADLAPYPGLYLCSNYEGGVAMGDCVRHGQATADRVLSHLATVPN